MYDVCGAGACGLKCGGYCPSRCLRRWGGWEDLSGTEESLDVRFGPARGTVARHPSLKTLQVVVSGLEWFGGSAWSLGARSPGRLPDPSFAVKGAVVGAGSQWGVWTQAAVRHCDAPKRPGRWHVPPHQGQVQVGKEDARTGLRALCVQAFRTRAAEDTGTPAGLRCGGSCGRE